MKKRNGYILIECVISITLLALLVNIISFSLNNSFKITNNNTSKLEMLSILKENTEIYKDKIRNKEIQGKIQETKEMREYNIKVSINKDYYYEYCYLIDITVEDDNQSVNLVSYETQQ